MERRYIKYRDDKFCAFKKKRGKYIYYGTFGKNVENEEKIPLGYSLG